MAGSRKNLNYVQFKGFKMSIVGTQQWSHTGRETAQYKSVDGRCKRKAYALLGGARRRVHGGGHADAARRLRARPARLARPPASTRRLIG